MNATWLELRKEFCCHYIGVHWLEMAALLLILFVFLIISIVNVDQSLSLTVGLTLHCE